MKEKETCKKCGKEFVDSNRICQWCGVDQRFFEFEDHKDWGME